MAVHGKQVHWDSVSRIRLSLLRKRQAVKRALRHLHTPTTNVLLELRASAVTLPRIRTFLLYHLQILKQPLGHTNLPLSPLRISRHLLPTQTHGPTLHPLRP